MITRVEVSNYCCLRSIKRNLLPLQILVGPNASGKSTFLDAVQFIGDFLIGGIQSAVEKRSTSLEDLFFRKAGLTFEIAVNIKIPKEISGSSKNGKYDISRYELRIGKNSQSGELQIDGETLWIISKWTEAPERQTELFPIDHTVQETIFRGQTHSPKGWRKVVNKISKSGNDYFQSETGKWNNQFRIGPRKSALANVPEDKKKFPIATWVKLLLAAGVQKIALNVNRMRKPCSPMTPPFFRPDGSNIPLVVRQLKRQNPTQFQRWLAHIQTVLSDVIDIEVIERQEDRHLYLVINYNNGLKVSSWLLSDGTLRFLALTLLPYIPHLDMTFLIEEPENGIHPTAIQAVFQSLSSVYNGQVLLATHSPLILALAERENILCFAKTDSGATDIVSGDKHPILRDWKGEETLDVLFASGVLG